MSSPTFELDSKIVRAGAGAGKTTQLTQNIYDIATNYKKTHDKWPRLVVTTFTRKATQELKERLIVKACDEKNDGFLEYVDSGANIHISTIHGVLNLFLRNYGHILGWDNSFQIINKREANILAKTIIKEMDSNSEWEFWLEHFSYSDLTGLLLNYYEISCRLPEAIAIDEKHLRELVKKYLKAQQQELRSLAELIISHIQNEKWLKWADYLLKVPENDILDYLSAFGRRPSKTKDIDEEFNESFKTRYERVKKNLEKSGLLLDEVAGAANFFNKFELLAKKFVNKYLEYKKKLSKLEMQDLELISHLILNQESSLGEAFAQEWDYWLIDEYQDTSPLQEALLKKLIGKSPSYIVGDPQQSIYLFRGARSEVFARKEQELINKRERLSKNYRSYSELLSFINDLFSHFEQSFMKMDFSHRYGEPQEERVVAKFYNGNDKKFVAKEVLGLMQQGISPEKICVLSRKNKPLMDMAFFLNSLSLPTHVHASGGFFQRREILDVLSLVRFLVNTSDNENLVGLLRSPWLAIEDSKIIEWTVEWKHWSCSLWQHLKYIKASVVEILEELLEKSEKWGVYTTTEICLKDWGVITYSHYHDASGRRESNIWKLFTQWHEQEKKPGFNIFNFLNQTQLDLSESEGAEEADAVAALEPNCINLMTIHASKGLQFEYVFIIEAGKKPQLSNGAQENNKIHLDENHNFWSFAVPTQEAGKKEKTVLDHMCIESIIEQELRESDRLFYVAVTRAVKNIYISWEGKYDENSWLGRCRFPLQLGTHQKKGYVYSYTNDDISDDLEKWQFAESQVEEVSPLKIEKSMSKRLQKISVTRFLDGLHANAGSDKFKLTENSAMYEGAKTAQLGSDIHNLLEKARYIKNWQAEDYILTHFTETDSEKILKAYNWVKAIDQPPMLNLLQEGFVEWGFQWVKNNSIFEGQIDLWGTINDTTWLIDYKSGSSKYTEKAMKQLDIYCFPLYELGCRYIKKAVIFPIEEKVIIVDAFSLSELNERYFQK